MSKERPFKKYQRVQLEIADMAFEGKGIASIETDEGHYVVFIPNTIPGQIIEAQIVKTKPRFAEAKLVRIIEHSPEEVPLHYQSIPGAPYINLPLDRQHYYKRKTSIELFRRIGGVEQAEEKLDEFISSPLSFHYRNKMEYSFSAVAYHEDSDSFVDGFTLGFKKRGQWLAGINLNGDSGMFDRKFEEGLPRIRDFFVSRGFKAWHARERQGFCRFMTVRKSFSEDALLINFTSSSSQLAEFDQAAFTELIRDILGPRLKGLVHTVNDDPGDRPKTTEGVQNLLYGEKHITEEILGLSFDISLESFFQTNPASAALLYRKALDYVRETDLDKPVILDLFSGTGTISQLLSRDNPGKKVIGVELVEEAVRDARKNAENNGFEQLEFVSADVGRFLLDHPHYKDQINTLVMDPPRAGIAPKTLRKVIRLGADRMVYISCNPATQARDIAILREHGYELVKYSLVDQFPHTAHIESVALFERGKSSVNSPASETGS